MEILLTIAKYIVAIFIILCAAIPFVSLAIYIFECVVMWLWDGVEYIIDLFKRK